MKKIDIENYSLIILLILIMVEGFLINGCLKNEKEIVTLSGGQNTKKLHWMLLKQ